MTMPRIRQSTDADADLPWVDFSALEAVNTCPRWGLIHSIHHKRFPTSNRAMALEAGSAMHDLFAAVRMFEAVEHHKNDAVVSRQLDKHGIKLFDEMRWDAACSFLFSIEDDDTRLMQFALNILETSGFYDDPSDKRRTQTKLEEAGIFYIQRYPKRRFIPVVTPTFIGVECGFSLVVEFPNLPPYKFVGKIDGVTHDMQHGGRIGVDENKTGARIDPAWAAAFATKHQPTGYLVAASTLLEQTINVGNIWGLQIPVPRASSFTDG